VTAKDVSTDIIKPIMTFNGVPLRDTVIDRPLYPYYCTLLQSESLKQLSKQSLGSVFAALRPTYQSIDIRALILKSLKEGNRSVSPCLFLKIRLTKEKLDELEVVHDKLRNDLDPGGLYTDASEDQSLKVKLVGLGRRGRKTFG
jgi:hypothetical protein